MVGKVLQIPHLKQSIGVSRHHVIPLFLTILLRLSLPLMYLVLGILCFSLERFNLKTGPLP